MKQEMGQIIIKYFFLSVMVLAMPFASSVAVSDSAVAIQLSRGSLALCARVESDFRLSATDGTAIGLKCHLSKLRALRLGLGFNYVSQDQNSITDYITESLDYNDEYVNHDLAYSISLRHIWYLGQVGSVLPYIGIGPVLGKSNTDIDLRNIQNRSDGLVIVDKTTNRKRNRLSYGMGLTAGTEFFLFKNVSVGMEFNLTGIIYDFENTDHTVERTTIKYEAGPITTERLSTSSSQGMDGVVRIQNGYFMASMYF